MLRCILALALAVCFPLSVRAADDARAPLQRGPRTSGADEAKAKNDKDESKKDDKKKKEEKDRYFALRGGTLHTVTQGVLHGMTVLTKNGRIQQIGSSLTLPPDTEVLETEGFHIYPGLVAIGSGGLLGEEPPDDSTNVYGLTLTLALAGGITTTVSGSTAAKLTHGTVDDMVVRRDAFKSLNYYTTSPEARYKLRERFDKVRQYLRDLEAYEEKKKFDPEAEEPDKDWIKGEFDTALKLMRREAVALMDANSAHELLQVCDLANRYGISIIARGGVEAWTVARELSRAGVSLVITPRRQASRDERRNRPNGSSIENAAILYRHGVRFAILPSTAAVTLWGVAGRDLLHLNMEAGFAVRGGLPNDAALQAITIEPARLLGIDHRVGSIEVGKDADFVIADGDLLHYMTHARWTVVNGRVAYDKQKETLFDHIRPEGDREAPPPVDYWPRRLGADH